VKVDFSKMPAYFINLRTQAAKRKKVQESLGVQGLEDVTWVQGGIAKNRTAGCALGHRNALEYVLEKNVFPCLVVEDDVMPYSEPKVVDVPNDADALYVGLSIYGLQNGGGVPLFSAERVTDDVYRLHNMLAAHAIVYFNREYVEFLLRVNYIFSKMGTNQDKGRAETMKYWNVYGLASPLFYQEGKYSRYTQFDLPCPQMKPLSSFYRA
jgi:hypothetical protein